jgi:NAD(P)-dependent dehydrogenase (short-subunit alcohol dehydrogenase family)
MAGVTEEQGGASQSSSFVVHPPLSGRVRDGKRARPHPASCWTRTSDPVGEPAAARVVETALARFRSIDVLVNNAGIFFTRTLT